MQQQMKNEKYLVVVSGPSGCGKDTVVKELLRIRPNTELSVSCTTRAMREHEQEGVDYYYITREEFENRVRGGGMLECAEYAGNYYGTPASETERRLAERKTVVLVIEVQGGRTVKLRYPHALLVFITPPSYAELERRLRGRSTETEEEIARRMEIAHREMAQIEYYDAVVGNNEVRECAERIARIIDEWQSQEDQEEC